VVNPYLNTYLVFSAPTRRVGVSAIPKAFHHLTIVKKFYYSYV